MSEKMTPLAQLEYQSISARPGWASNGIIDARTFRIGDSTTVHALSHAKPNRVRGACGVTAPVIEADTRYATWADADVTCTSCQRAQRGERLEELRQAIHAENISYGEIAELQSLSDHIAPGDVELLEWAGVSEEDARAEGRI